MVTRKSIKKKYALISVYDKSRLKYLCENLKKFNYDFISTGSTSQKIKSLGYKCIEVSKLTGFKEILDGRIKTLDFRIYSSILHIRSNRNHTKEFRQLNFPIIDIVIINLYPFNKYSKKGINDKTIEMIDIGGPSLLRASSKNYKYVTSVCEIKDYRKLINNLKINFGNTDILFRKRQAGKAFELISEYDKSVSKFLLEKDFLNKDKDILKYGENPHQASFIISNKKASIFDYQISGKKISYNNIIDIHSGLATVNEFSEPTCSIIKHNNACGTSSASKINLAFKKAFEADDISAFGGVVILNRKVTKSLARTLHNIFFEVIVAPDFDKSALSILTKKKKLILLKIKKFKQQTKEYRSTIFGTIHQDVDNYRINKKSLKNSGYKKASEKSLEDLLFGLKVVKHLKSNAVVLISNKQTVGIGSGQTSRIDSLNLAIKQYKKRFKIKKFVCASDGFFPFLDGLKLLKKYNCKAVAQPSGSINDKNSIEFAKSNKLSLYFTKKRFFKH